MDLGLRGRVAVVCASSQGLGRATASALAGEGAHVVMCARDRKRLLSSAKEIRESVREKGSTILPLVADMRKAADIRQLIRRAVKELGSVDILVTNAGGPPVAAFPDLDDEAWEAGFTLNLLSTIRCIREVLPHMQKRGWGRIINITSITVKQPVNDLVISSAVRPGILGLAKVLANQYGRHGITVNNVAPGYIMTARQEEISKGRASKKGLNFEQYVQEQAKDIPLGRFGTPAEFAAVVAFLASGQAGYVNGATISIDGGLVRGLF